MTFMIVLLAVGYCVYLTLGMTIVTQLKLAITKHYEKSLASLIHMNDQPLSYKLIVWVNTGCDKLFRSFSVPICCENA